MILTLFPVRLVGIMYMAMAVYFLYLICPNLVSSWNAHTMIFDRILITLLPVMGLGLFSFGAYVVRFRAWSEVF